MIKITKIYSDKHGESHFEELTMPLHDEGDIGFLSDNIPVKDIIFRMVKPEYDYDFHNAHNDNILYCLMAKLKLRRHGVIKGDLKAVIFC